MKKFITGAALSLAGAALLGALVTGCGTADTDTAESTQESVVESENAAEAETEDFGPEAYLSGINVADYVTLGEYTGVEVSVDAPVVTDEYLDSYIDYVLQSNMSKRRLQTGLVKRAKSSNSIKKEKLTAWRLPEELPRGKTVPSVPGRASTGLRRG